MAYIGTGMFGNSVAYCLSNQKLAHAVQVIAQARAGFEIAAQALAPRHRKIYEDRRPHLKGMCGCTVLIGRYRVG